MFGPNIIGTSQGEFGVMNVEYTGALTKSEATFNHGDRNTGNDVSTPSFDASRSSSLYGASITVQPSSLRGLACIKL